MHAKTLARVLGCLTTLICLSVDCLTSADDWAQWRGEGRDGNWNEKGIVTSFDESSLEVLWQQPISSGYSGPTVAGGLVYVMDRKTDDDRQTERVLCFDSQTGSPVWEHEYEAPYANVGYTAGPRASVTIVDGMAFSIGTMGHVHCLHAKTGALIWSRAMDDEYGISASKRMPIWGIAGSPLVYSDLVILHVGGDKGACIVALKKSTGEEVWRALDDRAQYSSPVLCQQNGNDVLVCWTGDSVAGLNPASGGVYWRHEFTPSRMPIGVATPVIHGNQIFLTSFYDGSLMLEMDSTKMEVKEVWKAIGENERRTRALHSMIGTPVWIDEHLYGVDSYGEFRCLKAADGSRIWSDQTAVPKSRWGTIHFVQNGRHTWMFTERGELVLGELSPAGFNELSRAKLIEPTTEQLRQRNGVCWSHPAYADRCIFLRNDNQIKCVSLAASEE